MIDGGAGNDLLTGGSAKDLIFGGDGWDILTGGAGNDMLIGGDGVDLILGGSGHDVLVAGEVGCLFTNDMLRDIAASWAADRVNDEGADDGTLDESVEDDNFDLLSGGSGADWFIINCGDWILDYRPHGPNGDVVTQA